MPEKNMKIYKYRFDFNIDENYPKYKEYNGETFNAPNEDEAWRYFLGISGEFGIPKSKNYNAVNIGEAYDFDGDIDQWNKAIKLGEVE